MQCYVALCAVGIVMQFCLVFRVVCVRCGFCGVDGYCWGVTPHPDRKSKSACCWQGGFHLYDHFCGILLLLLFLLLLLLAPAPLALAPSPPNSKQVSKGGDDFSRISRKVALFLEGWQTTKRDFSRLLERSRCG